MKAHIVIGANFGDEGKGHIVNYLSSENTLVVKFNGGAQAAHRVVLNDGREHVFHHFGAGSLKGARTLFGSHFIVNPLIFMKELDALKDKAVLRPVFIDPRCRLTTPYDMLINEYLSYSKGRHDTVGIGINETVERSLFHDLRVSMKDVMEKSEAQLKIVLDKIGNEYLPYRLKSLSVDSHAFLRFAAKHGDPDSWDETFLTLAKWIAKRSAVYPEEEAMQAFLKKDYRRDIVFEGGQGLLLDQNRKEFFPYLTRSSTGLRNTLQPLRLFTAQLDLTVHLVSRAYLTRHGSGSLWDEISGVPYPGVTEPTNPENEHQGKMRYAYLHPEWIQRALLETEAALLKGMPKCVYDSRVQYDVTCLDQLDGYEPQEPLRSLAKVGDGHNSERIGTLFPKIGLYSERYSEGGIVEAKVKV